MNVTLSVDEVILERALKKAREQGSSLDVLLQQYIEALAERPSGQEIARRFEEHWASSPGDSGGEKFRREDVYADRLK